jgi:hypothetical protein
MITAWLVAVVFLAALLQAITGFGFALIVMPLLTLTLDLRTAVPLVAMTGFTAYSVNLVRFRAAVDWPEVGRLAATSALGIPVGLWALAHVPEATINLVLGLVLVAYGVYSLVAPALPRLRGRWWFVPVGVLAGCLGAAYNTPGPPVIVYGSLRQWPKDEFRAVVQTLFFVNGILIVGSHFLARNVTGQVWALYALAAPALLLGLWVGSRLDRRVNPHFFRTLVTWTILALGASLLIGLGRG